MVNRLVFLKILHPLVLMMLRYLLLGLLLSLVPSMLRSQDLLDFYHVDTTQATPVCVLPHLYFSSTRSTHLAETSREDLGYLVSLLEANPDMILRIRVDGSFRRFDRRQNRLNRRRLKRVAKLLTRKHDIPNQRLVLVPNEPWDYRSAKEEPINELVARRLVCDCVWKQRKQKRPKVEPIPEELPSGELDPFAPINPAEVAKQ